VGVGAAVPVGVGVGVGVAVAVGVAVGIGVGVGVGVGVAPEMFGRTSIWAEALWVRRMLEPPKKADRSGVSSEKCPFTWTETVLPSASAHGDGVQVRLTSEGEIEKNEPVDSVMTAHITRFVAVLQAPPDTKDVGWAEASRAPARAALSIATWEWKIRARSAPAASRTRKSGRMTASSTRA
jgi:hypothetical protein